MLEQLKKAQGKGKAIQKSSGQEEEEKEKEEKEKVGTRIRLGLKPWGELKNIETNLFLQLFLLHIDDIISGMADKEPHGGLLGSTSVVCDQENKVK